MGKRARAVSKVDDKRIISDQNGSDGSGAGGNERTPAREPMATKWVHTWTVNDSSEMDHLDQCTMLLDIFKDYTYAFQLERGANNGKIHWQIYVRAGKRFRYMERWGKKFDKWGGRGFSEAARGDDYDNKYCVKEETRVSHSHTNIKEKQAELPPHVALRPLRKWQQDLLDYVSCEPDVRKVLWIWSRMGNLGKSDIAMELEDRNADTVVVTGRAWDAHAEIQGWMESEGRHPSCVVIDCDKGTSHTVEGSTMESIKKGRFTLTKGAQKTRKRVRIAPPHLVIFANEMPDQEKLSADRWVVWNID